MHLEFYFSASAYGWRVTEKNQAARVEEMLRQYVRAARGKLDPRGRMDLFEAQAKAVDATVARVSALDEVPAAVADYLRGENLPTSLKMAPDPKLDACSWDKAPMLEMTIRIVMKAIE